MSDQLDPDHWCNGGEYGSSHPDALAMEALDQENKQLRAEVASLRAERRWIPVEEQLPKIGVEVLAYLHKYNTAFLSWRRTENGEWICGTAVTHWMPLLPLPLKEAQG